MFTTFFSGLSDEKLNMTWQCALTTQNQLYPGLIQKQQESSQERGFCPSALPGETPPGVLHPTLGPQYKKLMDLLKRHQRRL